MKLILSKANISCALFSCHATTNCFVGLKKGRTSPADKALRILHDKRTKGLLSCAKAVTGKAGEAASLGNKEGSKPQRLACSIQESPKIISVSTVS